MKKTNILILVFLMITVGQFASAIYLPSMPFMVRYFNTTKSYVQWTVTAYYLSYGLSQFIYGPLSDWFGRRKIAIYSLYLFILATILALFSQSIGLLIFACFLQGMGIGSCGMLARTTPRDLYSGPALLKANAWINIVVVLIPLFAPVLGGYIQEHLGRWQYDFLFLLAYGLFILGIMTWKLPETHQHFSHEKFNLKQVIGKFKLLLTHRLFLACALCSVFAYMTLPAYEVAGAFLFQRTLHLSPVAYGWFVIIPFIGPVLGSLLSGRIHRSLTTNQMMYLSVFIMIIAAVLLLLPGFFNIVNVPVIILPMILFFTGVGLMLPSAASSAMMPFAAVAGIAGATLGGIQNLGASVAAGVVAFLPATSQMPFGWLLLALSSLSFLVLYFLVPDDCL